MSRRGCPNKKLSIAYPRTCDHCEYVSNNPTMYHYHKKTHNPIPEGQLCDHGCGQLATSINTHGKYTCLSIAHHCPEYLRIHSKRITEHWEGNIERRNKTRETFYEHCCGNAEVKAKSKASIQKKWGDFTPEQMKDFRHYARRVRVRAQKWAKEQGYVLGQQTFHVDHKLSVYDAYIAKLPESIVNHPLNLQILEANKNSSKGAKSILTVTELLSLINESNTK